MAIVTVEVPATTANVGPGFDCVGLALGLRNRVEAEGLDTNTWEVTVTGAGVDELPTGPRNLVAVAMRHVFERVPGAPRGARLRQVNGIPLCSGLGSSAAARVCGLVAANELCGRPFSTDDLVQFATEMEGHPDNVTPALVGGLVVAVLDSGRVRYVRFEPPRQLCAVVAVPAQQLATSESRRALPASYSREDAVFNLSRAALLVAALVSGQYDRLGTAMADRIHQPYRLGLIPGASAVMAAALEAGALGVAISGAGPSLLALCGDGHAAVAAAMRGTWAAHQVPAEVLTLALETAGATAVTR